MRKLLPLLLVLSGVSGARAAAPEITNIVFAQRTDGSMLADVTYDAGDADGDTLTIALLASLDGGVTWDFPALSVTGDVGGGVLPGAGRTIVWDVGADLPDREGIEVQVKVVASDEGVAHVPHSPNQYAVVEYGPVDWTLPGQIERYARADFLLLTANEIWGQDVPEEMHLFDRIRAINPDIVIIGYVHAKTVYVGWGREDGPYPFGQAAYAATRDYWCYTTTGDTLMDWFNQVNVNILEPDCRAGIISAMQQFQSSSVNQFDGVHWDYFPTKLWWPADTLFDGDPDLDEDGIPHEDDPDEIAAFYEACENLVLETRVALGDDFLQIFNGTRGQVDPEFAALSDGLHYEIFPMLKYEAPYMASALDPENPRSVFNSITWPRSDNGGPYILLSNLNRNFYMDTEGESTFLDLGNLHRVVGLLVGTYSCWNYTGEFDYGWPEVDISLGQPLGPTVIDYPHYTREFEFGRVEMEMGSGSYPNPFSYEIFVNGQLVEAFDMPYHFP